MWRPAFGVTTILLLISTVPTVAVSSLGLVMARLAPGSAATFVLLLATLVVPNVLEAVLFPFLVTPCALLYLLARDAEGTPRALRPAAIAEGLEK